MTAEQWTRTRDLFEQALETESGEVEAWLAGYAEDPVVVDEVRSLLRHHNRAGAFLAEPVLERLDQLFEDEASRFAAGDTLGAYRIVRELGRGGMGHVYLARDARLEREVALKVLAPRFAQDPAQRERLRREARAVAALTHPGICTVYALEEIGDEVVLATEYVEGRTLRAEIASGERPSPDLVLATARALATALAAAHARGITHRDLKPENVIRATDGTLKILDFGLALVEPADGMPEESPRVTAPGVLVGTPMYMAPEQIDGREVDARTDLWGLGVLLYEYASGVAPFDAASPLARAARILESEATPLASLRPDLMPRVASVVERCLRKAPADRFASALDLLTALEGDGQPADTGTVRWWRIHMAAVLALYVVAVAVAWLVLLGSAERAADAAFVFVMVVGTIGGVLRGHLLFAQRMYDRGTFLRQLQQTSGPVLGVDLALGGALAIEGLWVALMQAVPGALIAGLGIAIVLTRLVLERTTTEVAFGRGGGPSSRVP